MTKVELLKNNICLYSACSLLVTTSLVACSGSGLDAEIAATPKTYQLTDQSVSLISEIAPSATSFAVDKFCSPLSFNNTTWDSSLNLQARRSLAIALSLTGSYEGDLGWANLTNSFDGQGMSAGLLNQTLGTGSLEPLLAELELSQPAVLNQSFSPAHRLSFTSMIDAWRKARKFEGLAMSAEMSMMSLDAKPGLKTSSPLDIDGNQPSFELEALSPEAQAVTWAKQTLYDKNGNFLSTWRSELLRMLADPNYVSIQILAALPLHDQAVSYATLVGYHDLRTYLLMFDFSVQNGGITSGEFATWRTTTAKMTDQAQKLKALVEIRLRRVKPAYVNDVRTRKYAIIDGTGFVHGAKRNLPNQYCYANIDPMQ